MTRGRPVGLPPGYWLDEAGDAYEGYIKSLIHGVPEVYLVGEGGDMKAWAVVPPWQQEKVSAWLKARERPGVVTRELFDAAGYALNMGKVRWDPPWGARWDWPYDVASDDYGKMMGA